VVRDEWRKTNVRRGGTYGLATIPIQLKASGVKKSIDDALWNTYGIKAYVLRLLNAMSLKGLMGFENIVRHMPNEP